MELIFASKNSGKIKEVKAILSNTNIEVLSLEGISNAPDVVEDKNTFEGNAKKKAKEIYEVYRIPAVADDSGLVVKQLDGAPGVYSARYAGEDATYEDNNKKLIEDLKDFPEPHEARFLCTAVYFNGKEYLKAVGELKGKITKEPVGKNGFGYDPLFMPDGYDVTLAQLSPEEKNKISHRAKAFNELKKLLRNKSEKK